MRVILTSYLISCLIGYGALSMPLPNPDPLAFVADAVKRVALPPALAARVSLPASELII